MNKLKLYDATSICRAKKAKEAPLNNLAYICSPYRGNIFQRIRNVAYAKKITRYALDMGYTPIATHLYLTRVLNEDEPKERNAGLKAGQEILSECATMIIGVRYGVSTGMRAEIEAGEVAGKDTIIVI